MQDLVGRYNLSRHLNLYVYISAPQLVCVYLVENFKRSGGMYAYTIVRTFMSTEREVMLKRFVQVDWCSHT